MATALDLKQRLRSAFGHSAFRPHQEEVCRRTADGADGLVVMPTGAGKSLCYQLPGLMRGGPTLVFSPLIALMEDQTAKLRELGLRAERIHSGRPRSESRQACRLYRDGEVDFLFIAPERLGVPGFIEFLERCRPAPDRGRRSALHFAVGSRLQARLPASGAAPAPPASGAGARPDRDRYATNPGRHRRAARPRGRPALHLRLPAREPGGRGGPEAARGTRRGGQGSARR